MTLLEFILLPFAWLYALIMRFRNWLYDRDIRRSFSFETCVIGVGNLSVGGAGKTPMTEYLIRLLQDDYRLCTLSRGYGRKTRGFRMADENDSAKTLGDEPYQYFRKFERIRVAVGEERAVAIPFILAEAPDTDLILLDDAFQHRAVQPDFQILVTEFGRPFTRDRVMPSGRLREPKGGARRANAIVVSKCPEALTTQEMDGLKQEIGAYAPGIPVYFSSIHYEVPVCVTRPSLPEAEIVLVTGIANPAPLVTHLNHSHQVGEHMAFADHHAFSKDDIRNITGRLEQNNGALYTTEKDLMRLMEPPHWQILSKYPVYYLPIKVRFLQDEQKFNGQVLKVAEAGCS